MNNEYRGKIIIYKKDENQVYDSFRIINKLNSNISMTFNVMRPCTLPKDSKIEILETNCMCNIQKIDKEININGNKVYNESQSLEEYACIEEKHLNLHGKDCAKILINITEKVEYNVKISLKIKGVAYSNDYDKCYFEAESEGKDCINTIFISKIYIPNLEYCINDIKLNFINNVKAKVNSNCVFLSPLYDCDMNIDTLLGNVFINYELYFETLSLIPSYVDLRKSNKIICKNPRINIYLK